ncbi:MAG: hypothetical protein M3280_13215 [Actinomycetota bacterium]|nr:hypothetical protein [Actinomycetota bacterium]
MEKRTGSTRALILAGAVLFASCNGTEVPRRAGGAPSPSPSPRKEKGLCQPFPDRLVDAFIRAYNKRELEALENLVTASHVLDVAAAAYAGDSSFASVVEWATAGWNAGDRMKLAGYTALYPTKRAFQMHMTRRSDILRRRGVEAVSMTLDAMSRGCTIESLEMSGMVQTGGEPCAFYAEFATIDDVAANEPPSCRDGSGDSARVGHAAIWTGDQALLWGGSRGGKFAYEDVVMDGLTFNPELTRWSQVASPPLPEFTPAVSAWTGRELIVFGTKSRPKHRVVGAAYDLTRRSWRILVFPYRKWSAFESVWTGSEMILWGGPTHSRSSRARQGAIYNPAMDSWRHIASPPSAGRDSDAVTWTGTEMIVWGGSNLRSDLAKGAAYNPVTDTWREIHSAPISAREWLPITWTGTEVVVWGGSSFSSNQADGAAYNPATDSWRKLAPSPLRGRHYHSAVWAGGELIIFGGYNYERTFRDAAAYDPVSDSWRRLPRAPIAARCCHSALWTGTEMFVFGGSPELGEMALGDGALYNPDTNRWRRVVPVLGPSKS